MPISTLRDLHRQCAFSASPRIPAYLAAVTSLGIPPNHIGTLSPMLPLTLGGTAGQTR
jgi:hypothetical protein